MPITEKLKPIADSILTALTDARTSAEDPNGIARAQNPGCMSTKDLMAKLGETDLTKMRAALKALVKEEKVFKLGNTRSTTFKIVLPGDDSDSDAGTWQGAEQDARIAAAYGVEDAATTNEIAETIKALQDEAHAAADASDTGRVPRMTSDSVHVLHGADTVSDGVLTPEIMAAAVAATGGDKDKVTFAGVDLAVPAKGADK